MQWNQRHLSFFLCVFFRFWFLCQSCTPCQTRSLVVAPRLLFSHVHYALLFWATESFLQARSPRIVHRNVDRGLIKAPHAAVVHARRIDVFSRLVVYVVVVVFFSLWRRDEARSSFLFFISLEVGSEARVNPTSLYRLRLTWWQASLL